MCSCAGEVQSGTSSDAGRNAALASFTWRMAKARLVEILLDTRRTLEMPWGIDVGCDFCIFVFFLVSLLVYAVGFAGDDG